MNSTRRPCVAANCSRTSDSDRLCFCSVVRALKASRPPYRTEYRGGVPPFRMSGRCFSASSSHVVTCARMSRKHLPLILKGGVRLLERLPRLLHSFENVSSIHTSLTLSAESGRSPERQVDAVATHQEMVSRLKRQDAVIAQSGGTAPHDHVTMSQRHAARLVGSTQSSEQEDRRQAERDGDDRSREIALV